MLAERERGLPELRSIGEDEEILLINRIGAYSYASIIAESEGRLNDRTYIEVLLEKYLDLGKGSGTYERMYPTIAGQRLAERERLAERDRLAESLVVPGEIWDKDNKGKGVAEPEDKAKGVAEPEDKGKGVAEPEENKGKGVAKPYSEPEREPDSESSGGIMISLPMIENILDLTYLVQVKLVLVELIVVKIF